MSSKGGDYAEPHSGIPPATVSGVLPAQRGPAGLERLDSDIHSIHA